MAITEENLLDDLANDRLTLPTLPEVALRIRDSIEDDDATVQGVAKLIATDPVLSGRIVQVANSALYRGTKSIENVHMAVGRLGLTNVRNIVTSLVMRQIFQATHPVTDKYLRELWELSLNVASISFVLASSFTKLDPNTAMLAGLIHAVGMPPILLRAEDEPGLLEDKPALDALLFQLYPSIGAAILASWEFPPDLVSVASDHTDLARDTAGQPDYVDVVMAALLQAVAGTDHRLANQDLSRVPAFRRLGIEPDMEMINVGGTAENVDEVRQLLAG
jgi:HD-like signal output (HDOD) protein